jgi:hypothetical protein
MKYTVVWLPSAERDLTDLWLNAPDLPVVSDAADELDAQLARSPEDLGESRFENVRMAFAGPLGILFEVQDADKLVRVLRVWRCR